MSLLLGHVGGSFLEVRLRVVGHWLLVSVGVVAIHLIVAVLAVTTDGGLGGTRRCFCRHGGWVDVGDSSE